MAGISLNIRRTCTTYGKESLKFLSGTHMEIDPTSLSIVERYKLLIGGIIPRPIAFVSTVSAEGVMNLAPYSFFSGISSNPMSLLFCPTNHADGTMKDTLRHALPPQEGGTGQFVVNVATEAHVELVKLAGTVSSMDENEFTLTGLTPVPGTRVHAPRVLESPLAYECETLQVIHIEPGSPAGGNIVIGRVVTVHVRDDLINDRYHVDRERLRAIGLVGSSTYCRTQDRFGIF
jgi:flavin reductase (DIM6/NTAB) family NADH-FMN oxidoreductase RutF